MRFTLFSTSYGPATLTNAVKLKGAAKVLRVREQKKPQLQVAEQFEECELQS
jgi:hypothetical protein